MVTVQDNAHANTITWSRQSARTWSVADGHFKPVVVNGVPSTFLHREPFVVYVLSGVDLATHIANQSLMQHIKTVKDSYPRSKVIIVVWGLDVFYRKQKVEVAK